MTGRSLALLALASSLAACANDVDTEGPVRPGTPWFADEARERGLVFEHVSGAAGEYYMPEIMGGGAALFDMDGDGDLDAYLVQSGDLVAGGDARNRLFENVGGGRFRDATSGSGADDAGYGMGIACGDVDGDGDVDLYVTNVGRNTLLVNEGAGVFRDATDEAGVGNAGWGASATFFHANDDGLLDLYVTNYVDWSVETELPCLDPLSRRDYCSPKTYETPARDVLYLNRGDLRFEDATEASGIATARGNGLGVGSADFDGDGRADVFVANDGMPDLLWINEGDGTFANEAALWGCAVDLNGLHKAGMGVALGDVDADADVDLIVCNLDGESDSMFVNQGGYFGDGTVGAGLGGVSKAFTRFGMGWIDLDNDGLFDLYQANGRVARVREGAPDADPYAEENLLFRGIDGGRFEEVLPRGGTARALRFTSRAAAFGDVDDDGGIDVLVVNRDAPAQLFMNRVERGAWISLDVRERSGAPAIGARVTVTADGRALVRDVRAGYSYLASNDPRVHVGIGGATSIERVTVRWADGVEETFDGFEPGGVRVLRRAAQ